MNSGQSANLGLPDVSLIMPVHGPLAGVLPALQALARLDPMPVQLIVVADVEPAPDDLAALPAGALVVRVAHASGPAVARNAGAAAATADCLLFVDSDVVVPPDTVGRVAVEFGRFGDVAAIFGSYDCNPGDPGFLSQYRNLMHHFVHQRSSERAGTFWAGLGAIRAEVFRSVGGFDPAYRKPSIEDIELGCRIRDSGREIRLVKTLQGRHLKRWTAWGMLRTDLMRRGIPWMRLILARGSAPADLNLDWASRWSTVLAWGSLLSLPLAARGLIWGLPACAAFAVLVFLNLPFYRFLARHRGIGFAVRSVPWHFVHYLQCGLAGLLGLLAHGRECLVETRPNNA